MRHLKSIYFFFILFFQLSIQPMYAQQLPLHTFSLAAGYFVPTNVNGLQIDWRLDFGLTTLALDQFKSFHFTTGFLQPIVNRFSNNDLNKKYNPSIELKNTFNRDLIILFSKEPDLILFGFKIFDLHGQLLLSDQTKYRSSYAGRAIHINSMASGVYIMQVYYLPELMTVDHNINYWMKTIKFIKP